MTNVRLETMGAMATITIDRPPVNALGIDTYRELAERFHEVGSRPDISVVVLGSASDRCFSAGADVKELQSMNAQDDPELDRGRQEAGRMLFDAILNNVQPVIAAVNGPALGSGAVIAACCDIRYASERATIGLPEINVGRCGGGRHLMRLLPQGKVREMYFTGEPIDAPEAYRLGLFDRVVPADQLDVAVASLAATIAAKSPLALRLAKEALNGAEPLPVGEGYALEQTYTLRLAQSEDAKEAASAFVERRAPVWGGR